MAALGPVLPCPFGRYTLVERVGAGGMATVYRALLGGEGGFEKEVAVKVVREELANEPQFRTLFLDEARLSARLSHANLVQTFDFGQVDGTWFLAMEFVRGRTLANLLRALRTKGLSPGTPRSLQIAAEIARGLGHAHRLAAPDGTPFGLVHRDVSPQNVLVSAEGEVKLGDFGIAKAAHCSHVTQPGKIRGKCAYMAPEQARGHAVDARADVFALGVILWECLTGTALFDGNSDLEILHQVLLKDVAPPSRVRPGVPPEVDAVVLRMLARDAAARPANGDAVALELEALKLRFARDRTDLDLRELDRQLRSGTALQLPAADVPGPRAPDAEASLHLSIAVTGAGEGKGAPAATAPSPGNADTVPGPGRLASDPSANTVPARPVPSTGTTVTLRSAGPAARTATPSSSPARRPRARWRPVVLVSLSVALGVGLGLVALGVLPLRPPVAGAAPGSGPSLAPAPAAAPREPEPAVALPRREGVAVEPGNATGGGTPARADPPAEDHGAMASAQPPPSARPRVVVSTETAPVQGGHVAPATDPAPRPASGASARRGGPTALAQARPVGGPTPGVPSGRVDGATPGVPSDRVEDANPVVSSGRVGGPIATEPTEPSEGATAHAPIGTASGTAVHALANPAAARPAPGTPPASGARPAIDPAPRESAPVAELVVSSLLAADGSYVRIDGGAARPLPARTPITLRTTAGRRRIVFGAAGRGCAVAVDLIAGKNPALHQGEDGVVRRLDGTRKLALACE